MMVNKIVAQLAPYPMEELARIRAEEALKGTPIFDFGTGDPLIPTWPPIIEALQKAVPKISQYPSVKGNPAQVEAIRAYLSRRFGLNHPPKDLKILPTNGSKEAIFSIALALCGRNAKRTLIYPDPGYPVYLSSVLFAQGRPLAYALNAANNYELRPWELPEEVQKDTYAIWLNYPHNPTGAMVSLGYFNQILAWAKKYDVIVLSDDCYVDIYHTRLDPGTQSPDLRPPTPLMLQVEGVLSFMSLSKRSGITGYRTGALIGDPKLLNDVERARANFGCGTPSFIAEAATVAWNDDQHVADRRIIFTERIESAYKALRALDLKLEKPEAGFYLWIQVPAPWGEDDVTFTLDLAKKGVIVQPSQWLSEGIKGYFRMALVPETPDTLRAIALIAQAMDRPFLSRKGVKDDGIRSSSPGY